MNQKMSFWWYGLGSYLRKWHFFCAHCDMFQMQIYHPMYRPDLPMKTTNNLAKLLCGIDSLLIAKMNGASNWHPRAKVRIPCLPPGSFKISIFSVDFLFYFIL